MAEQLLEKINLNGTELQISDSIARNNVKKLSDSLKPVATSGKYSDLTNVPTIPSFTVTDTTLNINS